MTNHELGAALIIAYRRYENVDQLIKILAAQNVKRIYIAIDRNALLKSESLEDVNSTIEVAKYAKNIMPDRIRIAIHEENVGCSAAVLSACEWFFENEEFGLVLEDDCIPSEEFFTYANSCRSILQNNNEIWLFCGTQFAPSDASIDSWNLSKYALIWGWGTSRAKWNQIASALKSESKGYKASRINAAEKQYWRAGASRSSSGVVDAWDNVLIHRMLSQGKKAILPKFALVSNIGNDLAATHTLNDTNWMSLETGTFNTPKKEPMDNPDLDAWLKNSFYQISGRHILTTRITYLIDLITLRRFQAHRLSTRWKNARKNLIPLQ